LALAREVRSGLEEGSGEDEQIVKAAELLSQLLWQDVEPRERGYGIRQGTGRDRIPSVEDPEQRHGHKSHGASFTGYKAPVVAGNEAEGESAAELVEQVIADTAYGSMQTRQSLGDREVIAPTVKSHRGRGMSKRTSRSTCARGGYAMSAGAGDASLDLGVGEGGARPAEGESEALCFPEGALPGVPAVRGVRDGQEASGTVRDPSL